MKKPILQTMGMLCLSLFCAGNLQAQVRQTNLEVHVTSPTANQVFNYGDTIKLSFTLKNNGPDILKATDTLVFVHSLSQNPVAVLVSALTNNTNLASGATAPAATIAQATNNTTSDQTVDLCLVALNVNDAGVTIGGVPLLVSWNDADTSNNRSCVTITLKKQTGTGIFDVKNGYEALSLSPNPANNNVSFTLDLDKAEQVVLSVRDIQGREIIRKDYGKTTGQSTPFNLDITTLRNGIYFMELNAGDRRFRSKLSVQH